MMGSVVSSCRRRTNVAVPTGPFALDNSVHTVTLAGDAIDVYIDRPDCANPGLICGFHGSARNAESLRNVIDGIGIPMCLIGACPEFDEARFSIDAYQMVNIGEYGDINLQSTWTTNHTYDLVAWVKEREGRPTIPTWYYGHSAGAQYVSRLAAYHTPPNTQRFIVANPSSQPRANLAEPVPYGFSGFPSGFNPLEMMKRYLAAPVTVYLGMLDNNPADPELSHAAGAERQGAHRLARGNFVFEEAQTAAAFHGVEFGWRRVYAEGVGHDSSGMIEHAKMFDAMAP
jgi:pimeloyl-ACP methyl ester carboxylesterase